MILRLFRIVGILLLTVVALPGCKKREEAFEVKASQPTGASLTALWQVPAFSLIERDGRSVTREDLLGKVWIADFFYTSCPGPCPMLSSRLSELHKTTKAMKGVALVSISTDPIKDTPEVLKQYATRFGADEKWLFLTGEKAAIFKLANQGFKLSVTDEGGTASEPVTHSTKLALVDRNGMVRAFYDALKPDDAEKILRDIGTLLKENE
jgi:protein SCO1